MKFNNLLLFIENNTCQSDFYFFLLFESFQSKAVLNYLTQQIKYVEKLFVSISKSFKLIPKITSINTSDLKFLFNKI